MGPGPPFHLLVVHSGLYCEPQHTRFLWFRSLCRLCITSYVECKNCYQGQILSAQLSKWTVHGHPFWGSILPEGSPTNTAYLPRVSSTLISSGLNLLSRNENKNQSDFDEKIIVLLKFFDNFIHAYNVLRPSLPLPYVISPPPLLTLPSFQLLFPSFSVFFSSLRTSAGGQSCVCSGFNSHAIYRRQYFNISSLFPGSPSLASHSSVMLPGLQIGGDSYLIKDRALNWHLHTISSDSLS